MKYRLSDFNYSLPEELIAKEQIVPRDHSRLMVLDRSNGSIKHHTFYELENFLNPGDLLVFNNSKVFPARLIGKKDTGGKFELFLNRTISKYDWEAIGRGLKVGTTVKFPGSPLTFKVIKKEEKVLFVKSNMSGDQFFKEIEQIGQIPLPPYIKKDPTEIDKEAYQTVYAKKIGSVAAPTAGLHFTPGLLNKLSSRGVKMSELTLHVGLGTFAMPAEEDISKHKIHSEFFEIDKKVIEKIKETKQVQKKVIAVGTTSVRVLESIANKPESTENEISGWTNIFITQGFKFKTIDGMLTNFHLPKSTLLMLVSAFAGKKLIDKAYKEAIANRYRFYSYGDSMLIL